MMNNKLAALKKLDALKDCVDADTLKFASEEEDDVNTTDILLVQVIVELKKLNKKK